jgi:endonuclease/exonuclease/phosphatase family metal-dependent hydrolase
MKLARLVIAAGVLAALALPPSSASARPAPEQFDATAVAASLTHLTFNICGGKCNNGTLAIADEAADRILNRTPLSAGLQEVCEPQANRIRSRLSSHGYTVWFVRTRGNACTAGGVDFGNVLIFRGDANWRQTVDLPNPHNNEPRKLACAKLLVRDVLTCVTHIDYHGDGTRTVQINAVASYLREKAEAGHAAYVGGDFNVEPTDDQLDVMYAPAFGGGATGQHTEGNGCCTRGGEATTNGGRKIDFVFANRARFSVNSDDAINSDRSDHHAYWVSLTPN